MFRCALSVRFARAVEMLGASQAAAVLETDLAGFNRLLAAGLLHAIATVSGGLRVCLDSQLARAHASDQCNDLKILNRSTVPQPKLDTVCFGLRLAGAIS